MNKKVTHICMTRIELNAYTYYGYATIQWKKVSGSKP